MDDSAAIARSAMGKASWRILPLLGLGYLFAFMDRSNVGFAALQMNEDLGFSATVYGLGAGLFFLAYAVFEIPSNMLMTRFGARRWLARIIITWGLLSAATMFVQSPWQFYTIRFLLGAAEAGFFPGVVYYLASWYPSRFRGRAISRFYMCGPFASVIIGSLSGPLLGLDGVLGLGGWQWLLMVQGLPAAIVGFAIWRYLPDDPGTVGWLTKPEKAWLSNELATEAAAMGEPPAHDLIATLRHPVVRQIAMIGFVTIGIGITMTVSAPLLFQERSGLDEYGIGYVVMAGGILAIGAMLATGHISDQRGERFSSALLTALGMVAGLALMWLGHGNAALIAGYLVFVLFTWAQVLTSAMLWPDLLHPRMLALGAAAINTVSQVGAFVGPYAWGWARDATGGFDAALATMTILMVGVIGLLLLLKAHVARSRAVAALLPA